MRAGLSDCALDHEPVAVNVGLACKVEHINMWRNGKGGVHWMAPVDGASLLAVSLRQLQPTHWAVSHVSQLLQAAPLRPEFCGQSVLRAVSLVWLDDIWHDRWLREVQASFKRFRRASLESV